MYTGITTDVKRRFEEYKGGGRGSKYLRGKAPLELVLKNKIGDKGLALNKCSKTCHSRKLSESGILLKETIPDKPE